jgi:dihydroflavonol-4-reductase
MRDCLALVTGGGGFIGRHLVRLLVERGCRVRILDVEPFPDGVPGGASEIEAIRGSILDRGLLGRAMRGADYVFHLAADPNLWAPDKGAFARVNHLGTRCVLEEAERARPRRLVHTSTEAVLKKSPWWPDGGPRGGGAPALADMPGAYCRSKFLAEREAEAAARRGLPVVIVNPTMPVGPGDRRLTPPTRMILEFLNGRHPAYMDFAFNLVDVRDAALGHVLAAEKGRVGGRYVLAGHNLRLARLLDLLREITGLAMPRRRVPYPVALAASLVSEFVADYVTRRPPRVPVAGVRLAGSPLTFDRAEAAGELGLPRTPLETSLGDLVDWLAARDLLTRRPARPLVRSAA